jgi:hypothetical protein
MTWIKGKRERIRQGKREPVREKGRVGEKGRKREFETERGWYAS